MPLLLPLPVSVGSVWPEARGKEKNTITITTTNEGVKTTIAVAQQTIQYIHPAI